MARKLKKDRWIIFPEDKDIQFQIRPFSILHLKKYPSEDQVSFEALWEVFNGAVIAWKGIEDENGKELPCNEENKRKVAEENDDLLVFVTDKSVMSSTLYKKITENEVKN